MPDKTNFDEVFRKLKSVFKPHEKKMVIAHDSQAYCLLNTRYIMKNKRPL